MDSSSGSNVAANPNTQNNNMPNMVALSRNRNAGGIVLELDFIEVLEELEIA